MHRQRMATNYRPERNCGCIVATLVVAPLMLIWLFGSTLGGFGCEGADQPCTPRYTTFWLGIVILVLSALALAWLINAVRRRMKSSDE